jgi:hypothetical protein
MMDDESEGRRGDQTAKGTIDQTDGLSRRHGEHGGLKTYKLTNLKLAFGEGEAAMLNDGC